jgi:deazaflavin-dependent oxidoreductase (nitroreductase family)
MPKKVKEPQPPTGLARLLYRFPILMFRLGMGSAMGSRFLLLNHTGRKSGLPRQVVLEVVHYDEASSTYFVAAGFGPRSDWYQNLLNNPAASIQVARQEQNIMAHLCSQKEATQVLEVYANKHPRAASALAKYMGYETDGSSDDFAALGNILEVIRLDPID